MTDCQRCKSALPTGLLTRKGVIYKALLRRKTVHHGLRFNMWRITPGTENPWDQVKCTYTDLELCQGCAAAVLMFAQGREG